MKSAMRIIVFFSKQQQFFNIEYIRNFALSLSSKVTPMFSRKTEKTLQLFYLFEVIMAAQ